MSTKKTKTNGWILLLDTLFAVVFIGIIIILNFIFQKDNENKTPTAEELLGSIEISSIPTQLDKDTIQTFLGTERGINLTAGLQLHIVSKVNQITADYTVTVPFRASLDTYQMDDGRYVVLADAGVGIKEESPYFNTNAGVMEKSYFAILNNDLSGGDIYTRNYFDMEDYKIPNPNTVSDNKSSWNFVNDRDLNFDAMINAWNKDHEAESGNHLPISKIANGFKQILAEASEVSQGNYGDVPVYILHGHYDFSDTDTRTKWQELLRTLEAEDDLFKYWNLSSMLDYYGRYLVMDITMYFDAKIKQDQTSYKLLLVKIDLSSSNLTQYLSDISGISVSTSRRTLETEIKEAYIELSFTDTVSDSLKDIIVNLDNYTTGRMEEMLTNTH